MDKNLSPIEAGHPAAFAPTKNPPGIIPYKPFGEDVKQVDPKSIVRMDAPKADEPTATEN